jgi:hypothetical protein
LALLPPGLRLERAGNQYRLVASKRGDHQLKLELAAKVSRRRECARYFCRRSMQMKILLCVASISRYAAQQLYDPS